MISQHENALAFLESLADDPPQLPYEPSLLGHLFAGTAEDSSLDIGDIAALVDRSQGLAARVLRRANSAYYGLRSQVSSLARAIQVLGLNEVRAIILSLGLAGAFKHLALPPGFNFRELWEHQLLTAHLARELAVYAREHTRSGPVVELAEPDELYAAGLLHDLGKILIASRRPKDWQAISDLAAGQSLPMYRAEEAYWGLDHSVVGLRVLTYWQLPRRLAEPVGWHHAPALAEKPYAHAARLLAVADILAHCRDEVAATGALSALPAEAVVLLPVGLETAGIVAAVAPCFNPDTLHEMTAWFTEL